MNIQDKIDLQKALEPQVLAALQDGPLGPQELCDKFDAPDYIIKRVFWTLVERGQARLTADFDAAIAE